VSSGRDFRNRPELFFKLSAIGLLFLALGVMGVLLWGVASTALPRLGLDFLGGYPSRHPEQAGILPAMLGTLYLSALTVLFAFPVGVGAAVYLEEYASEREGLGGAIQRLVDLNLVNLASIPSIIYGLLGLAVFVRALALGGSLLAGALTLALLILPIIIISSREALRAVPRAIREASYALGASKWQTIRHHVLPLAMSGILTGTILAVSRAIGETAPLIVIGAVAYVGFLPDSVMSPFSALPVQIYGWISRPQSGFHVNAAAAIVVLLPIVLLMNGAAIWVRDRYQRRR
jgi:phosphate transport system permease protein